MAKFSSRHGYDPNEPGIPKVEEVPDWTRTVYWRDILEPLTYTDKDSRYRNARDAPLGTKHLGETYCLMLRRDPPPALSDSWHCDEALSDLLKTVEWYHFYDFVELACMQLRVAERSHANAKWKSQFGVKSYKQNVNRLFAAERLVWRFNAKDELVREVPVIYGKALKKIESGLKGSFTPSLEHYRKAFRYVYERPLDPENGIKEIVSAVESAGKIIFSGTSTLGDVVKKLRSDSKVPKGLVTVIEKFYAFSNAEPAIRHGGAVDSKVSLHDAEFCLHVGAALIRYLLIKHGKGDQLSNV